MLKIVPIVFADLQGTICFNGENYDKELIKAIKLLQENQGKFVINTTAISGDWLTKLGKEIGADLIISGGGVLIEDINSGKVIYRNYIANWQVEDLIKIIADKNFFLKFHFEDGDSINLSLTELKIREKQTIFFDKFIVKIEILGFNLPKKIIEISQKAKLGGFFDTKKELLSLKNLADKGSALRWVCQELKVDRKKVMAVGDGFADISAFAEVDYSYAIANSSNEVSKAARYHTSRAEQNGVGEAIYDYLYRLLKIKLDAWD